MLIRQSKNTFVRFYEGSVHIANQLSFQDRVYDEIGADFLKEINRTPQEVDDIVDRLKTLYGDSVSRQELYDDFMEFVSDLVEHKYLVMGKTTEELDANDIEFSYSMQNLKTQTDDFTQVTKEQVQETTRDLIWEESQRKPRLNAIQFELTSRCNERCIHCYIPNGKKNHGFDMPTEKVKSIIDEFAEMGGMHVTLSGGEVFLHKDIIPIMMYCREKDMRISILSNLISLKDEQIPYIKEANISLLQTSLYSMDPAIHDAITTIPGSQVKTKENLEKLIAADIPCQISCPAMKINYKGYVDVLKYAQSLKIKAYTDYMIKAQADFDTSNLANRPSLEETEELLRDIIQHDIDYKNVTLEKMSKSEEQKIAPEKFAKQPLCSVGINDFCITANGDVYPCSGWQAMICGNVYKQSLKDIWDNSPQFAELRKITQGSFPKCLTCEARDYCHICLVQNYNESNGDMFKINPHYCDVAFLNKRLVEELKAKLQDENH